MAAIPRKHYSTDFAQPPNQLSREQEALPTPPYNPLIFGDLDGEPRQLYVGEARADGLSRLDHRGAHAFLR